MKTKTTGSTSTELSFSKQQYDPRLATIMTQNNKRNQSVVTEVTKSNPCPHCNKPDWCYFIGDLSVCNREAAPAQGWDKTTKQDKNGKYYYAPEIEKKSVRPKQTRFFYYQDFEGNNLVQVKRVDSGDGKKPKYSQYHWTGKSYRIGLGGIERADIPLYKYADVREAIKGGETIYFCEGETTAEALIGKGLTATTNLGGSGQKRFEHYAKCLEGAAAVILCPDRDKPGISFMTSFSEFLPDALWLYAFPDNKYFWREENLNQSGGLDCFDWIEADNFLDKEKIEAAVTSLPPSKFAPNVKTQKVEKKQKSANAEILEDQELIVEEIYTQKCLDALYSEPYISIQNDLYKWNGKYYQMCPSGTEKRRILQWCKSTPVAVSANKYEYKYAKSTYVNEIYNWALLSFAVDPEKINPAGLNCGNGVLKIDWQGTKASYKLEPHDPKYLYTYCNEIDYNPDADNSDADRLLAALDEPQRNLFLSAIAASLDLETVRKYKGREVKGFLFEGTGSNGKDALREAITKLFGNSMSSASLADFQQYDQGRKFSLAKLEGSKINWSSENSQYANISKIQCLKAAITGDPIFIEPKNVNEYEIHPTTLFIFNINEAPLLSAGMESIKSRWAILSFNKTYKIGANPLLGEIEADPRFRYDPEFLTERVCPALLNKILEKLETLITIGLDYNCCDDALTQIQKKSNHLFEFCNDLGIVYEPKARLYLSDLWAELKKWYIGNGTLEIEELLSGKEVYTWHPQLISTDKTIKAINQLFPRLQELFPKISKERDSQNRNRKGQFYIQGLSLGDKIAYKEKSYAINQICEELKQFSDQELELLLEKIQTQNQSREIASPASPSSDTKDSLLHHCFTTASPLLHPMEGNTSESYHENTVNGAFVHINVQKTDSTSLNNNVNSPSQPITQFAPGDKVIIYDSIPYVDKAYGEVVAYLGKGLYEVRELVNKSVVTIGSDKLEPRVLHE